MSAMLENLQHPDPQIRKQAIQEAVQQPVNPEILEQIERLAANDPESEIRAAALEALDVPNLRALRAQRLTKMSASDQKLILRALDAWQKQGLLGEDQAQALRSRYRVVFKPAQVTPAPAVTQTTPEPESPKTAESAPPRQASSPAPQPAPQPVAPPQPPYWIDTIDSSLSAAPPQPPPPPQPRPSLAQLLLSEAAIKTFLYLGAFFVIASAVILAALVEELRLPILSLAVLAFGGTAVALKKRLPQPSFVLFVVFSFLLPINAGVFADLVNLAGQALAAYWTFVLLTCAAIGVFATRFYNSRFFSLTALGAFVYSSVFVPSIFATDPGIEARMVTIQFANLAGLAGVFLLARKKDWQFAQPAFLFSQFINLLLVASLVINAFFNLFDTAASLLWMANSAAWLLVALYYIASNLLKPFPLFPWFASAALAPVIFFFQFGFESTRQTWALGLGWTAWALVLTALSEITYRLDHLNRLKNKTKDYPLPLALAGIALFLFGGLWGAFASVSWAFALFLAAAILLGLAHVLRPRGWVWLASLVYGLIAYFLFFGLPFFPKLDEYLAYQITLAAILLALPDIALRPNWRANWKWFLPIRGLAIFMGGTSLLFILMSSTSDLVQAAVCAILLSGAYWLYAIRYDKAWLGYLPGLLLPLGLAYAFMDVNQRFGVSLGFAALSGLVVCYYLGGWALERFFKLETWSDTLRRTGLILTPILALAALIGAYPFEGWLVGLLAFPFIAETRRHPHLEIIAPLFLTLGFHLILVENDVQFYHYYLGGMTALWLGTDYLYKRILPARPLAPLTYLGAVLLTTLTANELLSAKATPALFAVSLGLTLFLLVYALLYRKPQLGYAFTIYLSITAWILAFNWLDDAWLWTLTPLALVLFGIGLLTKNDWGNTLRFSGLGLAGLTALSAPFAPQAGAGWFVTVLTLLVWLVETWLKKRPWAEGGFYLSGMLAFGLLLHQYDLLTFPYFFAGAAIYLLGFDLIFGLSIARTPILALAVRGLGGIATATAVLACIPDGILAGEVLVVLALTVFFALYAPLRRQPLLGYVPTGLLAFSILFVLAWADWWMWWPWALILLSVAYYLVSLGLGLFAAEWSQVLRISAIGLGTATSFGALMTGPSVAASIPIAIAASLWAVEAFRRRNVWLGFPANALYLMSYFTLLLSLEVTQPQFYSLGASLLGLLMHYLLTRARSDKGAFVTGLVSQLLLLGTTYTQMVANEQLGYFVALFFQALVVLVYGLVVRSRSLVGVPIAMLVLGVTTIMFFILRGLSTVILIGCTGIVMIIVATLAVVLRERLAQMGERLSGWRA
jgi:hypothetical protein